MYCSHLLVLSISLNTAITLGVFQEGARDALVIACENDRTCEIEMPKSRCVQGVCKCESPEDCVPKQASVAVRKVGEYCEVNEDCLIDNAECVSEDGQKVCRCVEKHVESLDGKTCLPVVPELNMSCQEDIQCSLIEHALCRTGVCKCKEDMLSRYGKCANKNVLGGPCNTDADCEKLANGECFLKRCRCRSGFFTSGSECLYYASGVGTPCKITEDCLGELGERGACLENKCNCSGDYVYNTKWKKCVRDLNLSQSCNVVEDCFKSMADAKRVQCLDNICNCKPPYKEFENDCVKGMATSARFVLTTIVFFVLCLCLF